MIEVIENLPKWAKITGISIIPLLLILSFLYFSGEEEAVNLPTTLEETKQNVSEELLGAGTKASEEASNEIISAFHKTGQAMADDVDDPLLKKEIIFLMTLAGLFLAIFVVLAIMAPILKFLGIDLKNIKMR